MENTVIQPSEVLETKKRKWNWKDNLFVYLIAVILLMFGGQILGRLVLNVPIGIVVGIQMAQSGMDPAEIMTAGIQLPALLSTCLMYAQCLGIWAIALLWYLKKKNRPLYRSLTAYTKGNNVPMLLFGLLLGFLMNGTCILAAWLRNDIVLSFEKFEILPLLAILICVFIQSSAEEVLCRSYLYQKLLKRYNSYLIAILGNSILFALLHLGNNGITVLAIVDIFVIGVMFSMLVYYFDSIWCAFGVHTAWNFTQNILFGLPNSGLMVPYSMCKLDAASDSLVYNVGFGVEGTVFAIGIQIVVCVLLYLWAKKHPRKPTDIWG